MPSDQPDASPSNTRTKFALHPSQLMPELRSWWRMEPHGLYWILGLVLVGLVGTLIYQASLGADVWPIAGGIALYAAFFVLAAALFQLLRVAAYGVLQLTKRVGLYDPLARAGTSAGRALAILFVAVLWIVGIGIALLVAGWVVVALGQSVRSMSVPAAIIVGAIIIAYAIASTRGR